ncbi:FAD dependent oxidoreductase superfamily [Aspergillus venezuelensis]
MVLPVSNSTTPFWRTKLHELDGHRSTPDLPSESDIVIIGAGFAGAALAHYIYEDNLSPPSVVILEAREACSGATGRNGGHMKPDVYYQVPKYIRKYGVEAAVDVARFEASQVHAVKELVEKEKIDCDFVLTRACDATLDPKLADDTHRAFTELSKSGVANLKDVFYTHGKDAERLSGVKGALSCFTFTAGHVWPYKMVMHLLQGVVTKGANLQTNTPVTHLPETPLPDGRWEIKTRRGTIKAKKVLLATNGYTSHLAPQFKDRIVPVRGICSRITVPKKSSPPFLPYTYSIRYGAGMYDYLIPRPDGSIIVGGAKPAFWHDPSHWYDVSDDSKLVDQAVPHFDGLMQRTFIGWETSGAKTDRVWTGIMGWTSDFMPYVGGVPGKPGQMVLAGFSGHGMPLILLSAKAIVQMLRHGKTFEETDVPSIFRATEERLKSTKNEILAGHSSSQAKL